jgi:hypothetical protein
MDDINENIAHITCSVCGKRWQALNEDCTDWDELRTAQAYQEDQANCSQCARLE